MAHLKDDCFAHGEAPMPVSRALALIAEIGRPVTGTESVPLARADGRVLAEDIVAILDLPPGDNAAVDGYAVFHADLDPAAETRLPVGGRIAAGHAPEGPGRRGEALRIFTGAALPEGPDTVVMQEDVRLDGRHVILPAGVSRGANRRRAGEDVRAGDTVLHAGRRLRPQDLGLAAAIGLAALPCREPLEVAVFSTGDELVEPGRPLGPGTIHDANRHAVMALLRGLRTTVTDLGILPDRGDRTAAAIAEAARHHHVLVTTGGVSVGEEDHVAAALRGQGRLHAWRIAVKPGKPLLLGQIGDTVLIGLPGNPAAAMVTFLRFARPLVLRLAGATDVEPRLFPVRAAFERDKKPGRREYVRVVLRRAGDGMLEAHTTGRDGAGILSTLVEAEALAELPDDMTRLEKGGMIDVLPFSEVIG